MILFLLFGVMELADVQNGERVLGVLVVQGAEILVIIHAGFIVLLLYI